MSETKKEAAEKVAEALEAMNEEEAERAFLVFTGMALLAKGKREKEATEKH